MVATVSTASVPRDRAPAPPPVMRVLTISADLLPPEIVGDRRARRSRAWVLVALALVVLLLAGWYMYADHQRGSATEDLDAVAAQTAATQRSQSQYREVVEVRSETDALANQLKTLLANDLSYATLISQLRATAKSAGASVEGVTATLNTTADAAGSVLPTDTAAKSVGALVIVGTAPDKKSVAAYSDKLSALGVVIDPYVTTVATTTDKSGVSFTLAAAIAPAAVCGRFTAACKTTGGK